MLNHVCTIDTVTGNLAVISRFHHSQINERYDSFSFFETLFLYKTTVSFTMVIKRYPGRECAGGGRSASKSTCVVPTWNLTAFGDRSASSMSKKSPAWTLPLLSVLGNGSFWVEIRDAKHVDRSSHLYMWSFLLLGVWPGGGGGREGRRSPKDSD